MSPAAPRFAEGTEVPVERSRAELDQLLSKHGAQQRMTGIDEKVGAALVAFTLSNRQIRLHVPLPRIQDIKPPPRARARWDATRVYEQQCRERWRAVLLLVKAKLETIAIGMSTVEREFLADIALPDGSTIHQALEGDIEQAYLSGKMPPLLGPARGTH